MPYLYSCRGTGSGEGEEVTVPTREPLAEGREHLTESGDFRSNKYPWCPDGYLPLKIGDPMAREVLLDYADLRQRLDPEFSRDLREAVRGTVPK